MKALSQARVQDLRQKIMHLKEMADTLEELARCCAGDDRPDCPILQNLETRADPTQANRKRRMQKPMTIKERLIS